MSVHISRLTSKCLLTGILYRNTEEWGENGINCGFMSGRLHGIQLSAKRFNRNHQQKSETKTDVHLHQLSLCHTVSHEPSALAVRLFSQQPLLSRLMPTIRWRQRKKWILTKQNGPVQIFCGFHHIHVKIKRTLLLLFSCCLSVCHSEQKWFILNDHAGSIFYWCF